MTSLNPTMTIGDQIAETVRAAPRRVAKTRPGSAPIEVLGLVGMPRPAERVDNYPHQLSGGMRQRVMIAMALACEPKLLIADEPTTALDVTIQKQILELIDDLRKRLGMAVILVTHDLGVIAGRADRVAVMYAGRVVETDQHDPAVRQPAPPLHRGAVRGAAGEGRRGRRRNGCTTSPAAAGPDRARRPAAGSRPRCRYAQDTCRAAGAAARRGTAGSTCSAASSRSARRSDEKRVAELAVTESVTAATAAVAAPPAIGDGELLQVDHLVKNFPVTAGAVLQRKVGEVSAVADVSFAHRARARRSAWSASPAAARPRSGGSSSAWRRPPAGRSSWTARTCQAVHRERRQRSAQGPADVPGLLRLDGPADAGGPDPARAAGHPAASAAGASSRPRSARSWTRWACPARRSSGTRTSSPAGSGSASAWPAR